ncbi:aromatic ring-hydroxylating oxygenase subunit alpha [Tropicimonas aquimaris]|uniref:Aromatic ring-hydroxylating dioxygenase subunit alpha n=1 Tax=Tropicimonas aquimaris TaxID=914152 RepID=A0ABW3IL49_9RHOB
MARDHVDTDPAALLAANTALPFERAEAMPPEVYTSQAFVEAELEHIFGKEWFCVGRASTLPEPGDYTTVDLAGQPVAVVRDRDGALRAVSNVCLHRMSTMLQGRGHTRAITCPYHGWTYNLDGRLRGAPGMGLNEGFCKQDYRLPQVRCEEWLGWVFVSLAPDAAPVAERYGKLLDLVGDFDMGGYVESFQETHVWDTNWKVLAENFMESYHLPVCHMGTIGGQVKLEEMVCPEGEENFNYHWILKDDSLDLALAHPTNTALKGDARRTTWLLSLYPGLFITLSPGYFWYLSLHPEGPGKVRILYGGGMAKEFAADANAQVHFDRLKALLDDVNVEDRGCTERVYKGLLSGLSRPGHLSHLERPNYEFAQYLNRRINGAA